MKFLFCILCSFAIVLPSLDKIALNSYAVDCSYILIEPTTGFIIDGENYDSEVNCGYLAKLMSLLLIAESIETGKFSLEDTLTASASVTDTEGSVIWLQQGDKLTVDELLKGVIVGNANDALTVLAEKSFQTIDNFVSEMNKTAFDLGIRNTVFTNPYGYYSETDYTTAYDIAMISAELLNYDFILPYFQIWRDFIKDEQIELVNENSLTRTLDNLVGFKACHSEQSGYCISLSSKQNDTIYIAVVLGADSEDTSFSTSKNLINKGFREYIVTVPGFMDEILLPMKVIHGQDMAVEIVLSSQKSIVVPKNATEIKNVVILPEYINAPVKANQKIGSIAFYNNDTLLYETDIITKDEVLKSDFLFVFKKTLYNLLKI